MENSAFVIDIFNREKENKIIEKFQNVVAHETIYLLNLSND